MPCRFSVECRFGCKSAVASRFEGGPDGWETAPLFENAYLVAQIAPDAGVDVAEFGGGRQLGRRLARTRQIDRDHRFDPPGRLVKTMTTSDRKIASCKSCVTNSTVLRCSPTPTETAPATATGSGCRARRTVRPSARRPGRSQRCARPRRAGACPATAHAGNGPRISPARRGAASRVRSRACWRRRGFRDRTRHSRARCARHHPVAREHVADIVTHAADPRSIDLGMAAGRGQQAGDGVQDRRFAAPRRADHRDDRAGGHVERDVLHRHDRLAVARTERDADLNEPDLGFCHGLT